MTHLTDNVQSKGPHPATRTELEARAEGHTPTPWAVRKCLVAGTMTMIDGPGFQSMGTFHRPEDAAMSVLACNSYAALRAENERLRAALKKIASCEMRFPGDVVDVARATIKDATNAD